MCSSDLTSFQSEPSAVAEAMAKAQLPEATIQSPEPPAVTKEGEKEVRPFASETLRGNASQSASSAAEPSPVARTSVPADAGPIVAEAMGKHKPEPGINSPRDVSDTETSPLENGPAIFHY